MPMIFDVLRSRAQSAEATALDTIAAAVALARRRAEWLIAADKVTAAKSKVTKSESALQAEAEKFFQARDAYAEKAAVLQYELDEANQAIRDGTTARERLLDPKNVPGGVAAEYEKAFQEARKAKGGRENAEFKLSELERRLAAVAEAVEKIAGTPAEEIDPSTWKAPLGVPDWQADGHGGELDKKLRQWREIRRERDAMRTTLAEASKAASTWQKKRDALTQEIIKS